MIVGEAEQQFQGSAISLVWFHDVELLFGSMTYMMLPRGAATRRRSDPPFPAFVILVRQSIRPPYAHTQGQACFILQEGCYVGGAL